MKSKYHVGQVRKWILERHDNCTIIAAQKKGEDRAGWLEDANYFRMAADELAVTAALREELAAKTAALKKYGQHLRGCPATKTVCSECGCIRRYHHKKSPFWCGCRLFVPPTCGCGFSEDDPSCV